VTPVDAVVFTTEQTAARRFCQHGRMSDPRNDAHDKKVAHEKKHHTTAVMLEDAPVLPSGSAEANPSPAAKPPSAALEGSLVVLGKLKELEFHSRANLERLAELTLTVEDELKQKEIVGPLGEVYSAQSAVQTKLTTLIEAYKAECDRMAVESV
jgi:hypothetical protein